MSSENDLQDDDVLEFFEEGQTVFFRPKLYNYSTWVQGKIIDFVDTISGDNVAILRPCGPGFGPKNSQNTFFTISVDHLYPEEVKEKDSRAPKTKEYTTRRNKGKKKR